jgi:hypothetical protein
MLAARTAWITATMLVLSACAAQRAVVIADPPASAADSWSGWGPPPLCDAPELESASLPRALDPRGLHARADAVVLTPEEIEALAVEQPGSLPSFDPTAQALVVVHAGCDAGPPRLAHAGGGETFVFTCERYCSGGAQRPSDAAYALLLPREQTQHLRVALCSGPDPQNCGGPPRP